jgi:hygromycin-B 4-O-kinase
MMKAELTDKALAILRLHYNSEEPGNTLTPLKGGEWSAAYRFAIEGKSYVIRLSHTDDNFRRDAIAARWSSPDLPIPRIITIDQYHDQFYAISTFSQGEAFENLSAEDMKLTLPSFLSMMTALQSVDMDSFSGYGTITPEGNGAFRSWTEALLDVDKDHQKSLTHGWSQSLAAYPEQHGKVRRFYTFLCDMVQFCPDIKRVIHSDLIYQNLLVHDHRISAVLDWGCAMIGDPVYDIAWFAFYEPWFPVFSQIDLIGAMRRSYLEQSANDSSNFQQRMGAYQIHLTIATIAYCAISNRDKDMNDHIRRLEDILLR